MNINSDTKLTGIIGWPLKKTLSPIMQNAAFKEVGINWCYVTMPVEQKNLRNALLGLKSLGFKGINVTMPHKESILKYLDEISPFAKVAGAVNTVHFKDDKIIGYNTDGRGFLTALERDADFNPQGKSVVILGAGGAASSIATILALNKIDNLTIINRTIENANQLAAKIKEKFKNVQIVVSSFEANLPKLIDSTDLIINATALGWEDGLIINPKMFHSGHLVADLVYFPKETRLLQEAKAEGAKILPGKLMLLYQGAASFEIWTKSEAPVAQMHKALNKVLSVNEKN